MKEASKLVSTIAIVLTGLVIYWAFADLKPSDDFVKAQTASDFSIENALSHLKVISSDVHHVGTQAHLDVQNYLVGELEELGLTVEIQRQPVFYERRSLGTTVENIVSRIDGTDNGETLMLLSHYDSAVPFSRGAGDDGSGVATILEGVRAFLAKNVAPKNNIIILFTDAEELGLLGARAFIKHHDWANEVDLILNFEARGSGGPSFMLMETNGKNSKLLQEFLKANPSYPTTNSLSYSVYKMLPNDTDLTPFRETADINGFNFAFIDDHFDYHTSQDSYERLDISTLAHQADYLMSTLTYFANSDISDLNSDSDRIFVKFPFFKMIHYPFAWNTTLFVFATIILIVLLALGLKLKKVNAKGIGVGFVPFLISLVGSTLITYGLWKLILMIHPSYKDMLHGFTYNGYWYIAAFSAMSIWFSIMVYSKYFKNRSAIDLVFAPIIFWLIVNAAVLFYLPGAAFFIIPVFMSLIILGICILKESSSSIRTLLFTVLSVPVLYMLSPLIKLFPVALGLGTQFISALFIVLVFGLMVPIFSLLSVRKELKIGIGSLAVLFFIVATAQSGFSVDRKKPTNITFYYNADQNVSYWASRNSGLDEYVTQFLGNNPDRGRLPDEAGMRSSVIKMHKKTQNRDLEISEIRVELDTIIGDLRRLEFAIVPKRKIHRYELFTNSQQDYIDFSMNGASVSDKQLSRLESRLIARYSMATADSLLHVSCTMKKEMVPNFRVFETSYDLETNPAFDIDRKPNHMMPFAFVTGDAIVAIQTPDFEVGK